MLILSKQVMRNTAACLKRVFQAWILSATRCQILVKTTHSGFLHGVGGVILPRRVFVFLFFALLVANTQPPPVIKSNFCKQPVDGDQICADSEGFSLGNHI